MIYAGIKNCSSLRSERGPFAQASSKFLHSERGSVTLESAIIVPIAVFVVCLSIYIVLLLFEQAQLQSSTDYAAHRTAAVWRGGMTKDAMKVATGAGLYNRIFDPDKQKKVDTAAKVAERRLDGVNMPGYAYAGGSALYKNGLFGKTLSVGLDGVIVVPNRGVTTVFGFDNTFGADYDATSLMPDFAENIRCIDYVLEIEKCIEEHSPEFASVANGFTDVLDQIKDFLGGTLQQ